MTNENPANCGTHKGDSGYALFELVLSSVRTE